MDKYIQKQREELTEYFIYRFLAKKQIDKKNKRILLEISNDELRHHNILKEVTKKEVKIYKFYFYKIVFLSYIFGIVFALKLMENGERDNNFYERESSKNKSFIKIIKEEKEHEISLINMLKDKKLEYSSSIVLGLSDSLVEITGALCGLYIAFSNTQIIGLTGLIIGISASMSMGVSEFLSNMEEKNKNALRAAFYTGSTYFFSVLILVSPFLILENKNYAIISTFFLAMGIIILYNFFRATTKNLDFKKSFIKMFLILFTVSILSILFSFSIKVFFGIEV